ncbi:MAG: hypothetical protein P0Y53_06335 [Candidatus Pseudobacter hemicellulosilyticus]|uniref:Uncharacterized protein n=1 Tax=Candidatus Pseudobacter hemicellulosilyticus TaxID=3121375 RepID=A0AAJ6BHD9_9BACT|nr:MAG: hypothetical protein P0Y53_06335 [Pseudobacter sp.]
MTKLFFLCAVALAGIACTDTAQKETERKDGFTPVLRTKEDSLYHAVIEGHDVGMAKMGILGRYTARVQAKLDSMSKQPKGVDSEYHKQLVDLRKDLQQARQGMNAWMDSFSADSATGNEDLRIQYLESERVKVNLVRDKILLSLQKADSLFAR